MKEDSFYEKCDKVLFYLLAIYKRNNRVQELIHINQLEADTGIDSNDAVINFLIYEKKFVYMDLKTAYLQISTKGIAFISHSSFVREQENSDTAVSLKWYDQQNAKDVFDNYPEIKKKANFTFYLSIITALVLILELIFLFVSRSSN